MFFLIKDEKFFEKNNETWKKNQQQYQKRI